jgi:hypothetical protein
MAKFDIKFLDTLVDANYIKCEIDNLDLQNIIISGFDCGRPYSIYLDKSTAIKFAKTLRTEINKITESEVYNGTK